MNPSENRTNKVSGVSDRAKMDGHPSAENAVLQNFASDEESSPESSFNGDGIIHTEDSGEKEETPSRSDNREQGTEGTANSDGTGVFSEVENLLEELEHAEERLREVEGGLARSHRLQTMGTIAAIIAHEFNNILTPVISYCQMGLKSLDDRAFTEKALTRALAGAERAATISNSMLGFARDDAEQGWCEVNQVLTETLNCIARPPERDGIQLAADIDISLYPAIGCVPLQQVLLNLILNAREAMKGRSGQLMIRGRRAEDAVEIDVIDSGPGIPKDMCQSIFTPFVSRRPADVKDLSESTTSDSMTEASSGDTSTDAHIPEGSHTSQQETVDEKRGTGLGLTICRDLVEGAGGTIEILKTDSTGTTFRIVLPWADEADRR